MTERYHKQTEPPLLASSLIAYGDDIVVIHDGKELPLSRSFRDRFEATFDAV
jgi:hypothetical protein